ncbi:hypothetical protein MNBD_GAMMA18-148 [hydrothermal vent metagenome]|uniref:Flagellar protein FlaG n=2 Tax=hydrothermal vent metagenome TaxID=652676 RepID=A0A3B0YTY2_9ZZZZ
MNIPTQLPLDPPAVTTNSSPNQRAQNTTTSATQETVAVLPVDASQKSDESSDAKRQNDELNDVVKNLNDHIQQYRRELQFEVDEKSGRTVVKVMDIEKNEVIRQMPSEEVLAMSHRLTEMTGTMFQEKA